MLGIDGKTITMIHHYDSSPSFSVHNVPRAVNVAFCTQIPREMQVIRHNLVGNWVRVGEVAGLQVVSLKYVDDVINIAQLTSA